MGNGPNSNWLYISPDSGIQASEHSIEAWTSWQLPFDGNRSFQPTHRAYRDALRSAISDLKASGSLHATYASEVSGGPDIENVLFYNVGTSAFRRTATHRLLFERMPAPFPITPWPTGFSAIAYARYETARKDMAFQRGCEVARCEPVRCELHDLKDAGRFWRLCKPRTSCGDGATRLSEPFKVRLVISAPQRIALPLVSIVKTILDGFVSVFHHRDALDVELHEVATRLMAKYGWSVEETRSNLLERRNALLGARDVPRLYRQGVQWSPADHLLTGCEVKREFTLGDAIEIQGSLFRA